MVKFNKAMREYLSILHKPGRMETIDLGDRNVVIGKSFTCDIVLDSPYISRKHCTILFRISKGNSYWEIWDGVPGEKDRSRNGTYINGTKYPFQKVYPNGEKIIISSKVLENGDIISFATEYPRIRFVGNEVENFPYLKTDGYEFQTNLY